MTTNTTSSITPLKPLCFDVEGISYLVTSSSTVKVIPNKNRFDSGTVTIPETITFKNVKYIVNKIGASAFSNNYNLNSITIPSSICAVEENAFNNNHNLIQVICNVTTPIPLDRNVFGDTTKNCKLVVPKTSLTAYKTSEIWKNFSYITNLLPFTVAGITYEITSETTVKVVKNLDNNYVGSIVIPASILHNKVKYDVTEISQTAFKNNENITAINIGSNITTIKAFTFSYCKNLASIIIPNSVTSIEKSAFSSSGLISFTFPNSVTTIENHLFIGCEKLTTITIPNTITTMKEYSFGWCPKLTTLVCNIESPLKIHSNVFFETNINACNLKVPSKNIEAYKTTNVWIGFKSIMAITTVDTTNL
ncbi:leucine-rich repeat domain-containing protein [Wenyingzhuangia sp. chi5]|uniref:Leucine-rich repeat domain-containing protein n=1 Tax=Wenyingzhuangia gilva TaxID=3057677 RepID=A0ABT8VS39_9FLAO|nr:leucine-rich repeat domain-containing protein [Wenyingzhuangia sp. chi5]MDO3694786.1 leucine-rich repeat domain-containing protein [Wenyingzhuangia sp. chi5]